MDASNAFAGKRITLMGLGLLGRGVGDARYLASCGAELIVTDLKSEADLASSLEALKEFPNITYTLGRHELADFRNRDLVLMAQKAPADSPYIQEAKAHGSHITMSTALFAKLAGIPIVGVTGTRGKSTTTYMIAKVLEDAGKKVILGGNIRGVSTLALLPDVTPDAIGVLELDSWQLQGFREESLSPNVGVFTTFYPDHMDYYQGDLDAYLKDKAEIFLHQKEGDTFVLGSQAKDIVLKNYPLPPVTPVVTDIRDVSGWSLKVPGTHNLENAACARCATLSLGIEEESIRRSLESFSAVPGRLELVRELRGISIYNDTNATTPEATIAALRALSPEGRNVVLIMGGSDKGLSMSSLIDEISLRAKRVIMLTGTGTNTVLPLLPDASVYDDLTAAVAEAVRYAKEGDSVLFSPAFASFGMFKNEYDRGDQFVAAVEALT